MSDVAREILVAGAGALAHADGLRSSLEILLESIADQLDAGSAAIFMAEKPSNRLQIVATFGLEEKAIAGLAEAVANPNHPVARTITAPIPSFNVQPTAPGGPALRSHVPLVVTRGATDVVVGVLALAHEGPFDPDTWPLLEAGANLAAVAIERHIAS
jgi:GAF domain-containing protein